MPSDIYEFVVADKCSLYKNILASKYLPITIKFLWMFNVLCTVMLDDLNNVGCCFEPDPKDNNYSTSRP